MEDQALTQGLTGGGLLRRNIVLNMVGWGLPALFALVAVPILVRGYGDSRFGVLAIAWSVIGYFGLFDLGLSRALTQRVSEAMGKGAHHEIAPIAWSAMAIMLPLSIVGAILLSALAPWVVERALVIPAELQAESVTAFRIFAVAVPFTVFTAGARGMLEAGQHFGAINALRIPLGLLTFGAPLIALHYSPSLVPAAELLATGRCLLAVAHAWVVVRNFPTTAKPSILPAPEAMRLVRYGGWMTISNVISPLMSSMDRFGLGVLLPVAAVAFYATSYELVTKVWLVTAAVLPVLFPAMSATLAADRGRAVRLFERGTSALMGLIVPLLLVMVLFARPGIGWWVNAAFAEQAAPTLQWLAVAMSLNIVAQLALTLIQAADRPDVTAMFHIVELPIYAVLLWGLVGRFGVLGAAFAWGARVALDSVLLLVAAARIVPESARAVWRAAWIGALSAGGLAVATRFAL